MSYAVNICDERGNENSYPLSAGQTTIGSDKGSTITLGSTQGLLSKHILLVPDKEGCWVSTVPGAPLRDEKGNAVEGQYVSWGSQLCLGRMTFLLNFENEAIKPTNGRNLSEASPDTDAEPNKKVSPLLLMTLLLALGYLGSQYLVPSGSASAAIPREVPALFDDVSGCSSKNSEHRAIMAVEAAQAKQERSVFDLQDGIEAVHLYAESAYCHRVAGNVAEAERVGASGLALRTTLEADYKLLRLGLERALVSGQRADALGVVGRLRKLLQHRESDSYVLALRRLELELSRKPAD